MNAAPKVQLAALAREKIRRSQERAAHREIIKRLLVPAASKCVRVTVLRRLLRICGLTLKTAETLDILMEVFPGVTFSRDPKDQTRRAYVGVRVRPGFSAAALGELLRKKYLNENAAKVGPVAEYEAILESEGMPSDITKVPDPAGPDHRELPQAIGGDDEWTGDGYSGLPTPGTGRGTLASWPRRATPDDPSIAPAIAEVRNGLAELAYRIPGFFSYNGWGPDLELMWRLVRIEGMKHIDVGKIVKRTANDVKLCVQRTEKRLMKHLRNLGEPNVKRLFDIDNPVPTKRTPERYLFANCWKSETERLVFEKATFEKARPTDIAAELGLDAREVAKILRRHRIRARLPLESL